MTIKFLRVSVTTGRLEGMSEMCYTSTVWDHLVASPLLHPGRGHLPFVSCSSHYPFIAIINNNIDLHSI